MDIVTDLTSQAISFLTLLQDISKDFGILRKKRDAKGYMPAVQAEMERFKEYLDGRLSPGDPVTGRYNIPDRRTERIKEIVFCSSAETTEQALEATFYTISNNLIKWIERVTKREKPIFPGVEGDISDIILMSPDEWRREIRNILYDDPYERVNLARAIHYIPALIVLTLSEKPPKKGWLSSLSGRADDGIEQQRKHQVFEPGTTYATLAAEDRDDIEKWWSNVPVLAQKTELARSFQGRTRTSIATALLRNDQLFFQCVVEENPVSFEMIFNQELEQIERSREARLEDLESDDWENIRFKSICPKKSECEEDKDAKHAFASITPDLPKDPGEIELHFADKIPNPLPADGTIDPLRRAEAMQLTALAFSGGGIRSATFNLGVIQKLAEKGVLHHIDYLSTVSGGGYIGSWLLSWIYRAGSISKVTNRLNSARSTDPMADEVRPLRWLRMYSNYLSPNAGVMSTDAWTIGITWIRNTLINQIILLLLLCTALAFVEMVYMAWEGLASDVTYPWLITTSIACAFMAMGTHFAAEGMRTFNNEPAHKAWINNVVRGNYAYALVVSAALTAFFLSTWLFKSAEKIYPLSEKLEIFVGPALFAIACLVYIAYKGKYHEQKRFENPSTARNYIFASSVVGVVVTFLLMTIVWKFYELIRHPAPLYLVENDSFRQHISSISSNDETVKKLAFTFGLPLMLEMMSLGVVFRMFIMGIFFPDERREWWGRTGAELHRFMLIWILMTIAVFFLPKLANRIEAIKESEVEYFVGLVGGWAAIVGFGVRLAFGSTTSGENKEKTGLNAKEIFVRLVPYLFMIGFLLIGSATLNYLLKFNTLPAQTGLEKFGISVLNFAVLLAVTALLSYRAGVNEFTLHHFYRNRLIRAYLGATRRRTERIQTANSFTGFDSKDDIPLEEFRKPEYYGPYPLINTALNATVVSELDRQDRKAESFIFSPLFCGFDFSATRAAAYNKKEIANYGYRPTAQFADSPTLGTAMAISGAAVNPNMGYHSSAATAFLLSVFNVKLGWWLGNPRTEQWQKSEPTQGLAYLVFDLIGKSDMSSDFVNLSDGGHFDNMGLYELVRRRCHQIIVCDAEEDNTSLCEGLAMAVRRCRIDFGVEIDIDTSPITSKDANTGLCRSHVATGTIKYPGNVTPGTLIYIKTALNGDESADIREYKMQNPKFPQQPTSDQFFTEEQFESYRKLGYHSID
ncbi:hypothetical protein GCM10010967_55290 [Dyadobacter beijingensis]|uniref:PNPLA domain-containing protein n=1 Tax=Dyadobacter beijingensis TaxID=365489 RepID=A0ABQ2ILJ9_9BACT|nr:patatin-like phospholipase family protein [Dyadobacter beijingensis]GGN12230.1 hypothetical protein GCM10010967_55290 [Dyadobacter beijingensis]